jgi:3-hydroxyacyl-[acyl-carrier-protein] dehydratase
MLQDNFFEINNLEVVGFDVKAELTINVAHKIFEGHFPGQPVVPGVCIMQMVKEIMEKVLAKKTNLSSSSEIKFLAIINPVENNIISATLKYAIAEDGNVNVTATLFKDALVHFKMKGVLAVL